MSQQLIESEQFNLQRYLEGLCKRHHFADPAHQAPSRPEIDFLLVEKELGRLQGVQERTCEQIVEFVDQHRDRFIEINGQLGRIEGEVAQSEALLKLLGSRVDEYKATYYVSEAQIQRFISSYEMRLLREQVLGLARSEAQFLAKFNLHFEDIMNREIGRLSLTQKYLISRFTYKCRFFKALYSHQIIRDFVPDMLHVGEIVTNLVDEFEFYLGEQLAKYQGQPSGDAGVPSALAQIRTWYVNMGKSEEYYRVLERHSIEAEIHSGQKLLLANKTTLLSGREQPLLQSVFVKILKAVREFPEDYPHARLENLVVGFFRREELKFLYTYAMPIFPIAFRSYLSAIEEAEVPSWLAQRLRESHGWNLKMWVTVREKNILDRSGSDSDMFKWVDIIFKPNCLLPGTLPDFLRLTFKLITRHLTKTLSVNFESSIFNRLVEQHQRLGEVIAQKIIDHVPESEELAKKVEKSVQGQYMEVLKKVLQKNL